MCVVTDVIKMGCHRSAFAIIQEQLCLLLIDHEVSNRTGYSLMADLRVRKQNVLNLQC